MKYNDKYFNTKLEINSIFEQLIKFAIIPNTINKFKNIVPYSNIDEIREELAKVDEAMKICVRYERAPIYFDQDINSLLDIVSKGGFLIGIEIYEIIKLFTSIKANERLVSTLEKENFVAPFYKQTVKSLYVDETLFKELYKSVDDNGYVLDEASPNLKKIRNRLRGIDDRIKNKLQELIGVSNKYLSDTVVVIRDDRYCLAIKAEFKNTFRGILHDTSATNLTAYMEPLVIAEMTNEKERLRNEEKEEIEKILRYLSSRIASNESIIRTNFEHFLIIDELFSKGMLAVTYDGEMPSVNNNGILNLVSARHPLLKVDKVIPNNINFGKDTLGIIITGPNTGGKTVLLKTIGLLSLMTKYGLLIPASKESNIMIFDHIFCDIGDDQSIEENLSTFSSHMKKMVAIVNMVTPNSLALFDEIGAGTDPSEGAAIAISVLKYFLKNKVSFVTTTHYSELKAFAYGTKNVVNASMEFNKDTLKPTYHLVIGKSGASNAFAIAKGLGLKQEIIDLALINTTSDDITKLIDNIEQKSIEISKLEKELELQIKSNKEKQQILDARLNDIEKTKEKILKKAEEEANSKINKSLNEANEILEEIKNLQSKSTKMHELIAAKQRVDEISDVKLVKKNKQNKNIHHEFKVGDNVFIHDYEQYGIISRIRKDKTIDVSIGNISVTVEKSDLDFIEKNISESNGQFINAIDIKKSNDHKVSLTLDLRGIRLNEAKDMLEKYIDDLMVNNFKQASIIHGFGTGAIREMVQDYCRKSKYIKEYRYGGAGEGGLGVTVISLK